MDTLEIRPATEILINKLENPDKSTDQSGPEYIFISDDTFV